jgi:rare lipoprotein A
MGAFAAMTAVLLLSLALFHGRQTASGEIFDQTKLTAAHPTLPLRSWIKVTNLTNERSVLLQVNDRGPYVDGRIVDVSHRAAQLLGFEKLGLAKVRVEVIQDTIGP